MGSFAEVLAEASRREPDDSPVASPFAEAVRAFEDRVATASQITLSVASAGERRRELSAYTATSRHRHVRPARELTSM